MIENGDFLTFQSESTFVCPRQGMRCAAMMCMAQGERDMDNIYQEYIMTNMDEAQSNVAYTIYVISHATINQSLKNTKYY